MRLLHAGVRRKDGVFATGVLHLWHPAADRSWLPDNDRKLDDVRAGGRVMAERGMSAMRDRRTRMHAVPRMKWRMEPEAARKLADGLAAAVVVAIPWSTSVAYILMLAWAIVAVPNTDPADWRSVMKHPAAYLAGCDRGLCRHRHACGLRRAVAATP